MAPAPAIKNLQLCYASIDSLLGQLDAAQWRTQSYCPEWDVRGIATHLGAVEFMLTGEAPGAWTDALPFAKVGDYMARMADLDTGPFLATYRETVAARAAELDGLSEDQLALPSMTPVGPKTYGQFMAIRVFDFWVHEQDMRGPLGLPGHLGGPAAEMALDEIEGSLPYIVGKKIGLADRQGITFELTGAVQRTMHVKVDGRAASVSSLDDPDVVVTADSTAFALLACGRIDPQGPIDAGTVSWTGDAALGEKAARSLRFTM